MAAGKSAGFAWRAATRRSIAALQSLDDSRLRERADDLLDVEAHVLLALAGEARPMHLPLPEQAILLADDLLPSELTALDRRRLAAIALSGGGATSHVAILAAAMEIPMLIGIGAGAAKSARTVRPSSSMPTTAALHDAPPAEAVAQAQIDRRRPGSPEAPRCARRRSGKPISRRYAGRSVRELGQHGGCDGRRRRTAPRAVACFEPSFCSSIAPRHPTEERTAGGLSKYRQRPWGRPADLANDGCGRR